MDLVTLFQHKKISNLGHVCSIIIIMELNSGQPKEKWQWQIWRDSGYSWQTWLTLWRKDYQLTDPLFVERTIKLTARHFNASDCECDFSIHLFLFHYSTENDEKRHSLEFILLVQLNVCVGIKMNCFNISSLIPAWNVHDAAGFQIYCSPSVRWMSYPLISPFLKVKWNASAGKEISYTHKLWMDLLKFIGPDANCIKHKKEEKKRTQRAKVCGSSGFSWTPWKTLIANTIQA